MWAAGCVLYELCTLRKAFDGASLPALVVKILRGRYPPVPGRYSAELRRLVDSMLRQNPRVSRRGAAAGAPRCALPGGGGLRGQRASTTG